MKGTAHMVMGTFIGSMAVKILTPDIPQTIMIMGVALIGSIAPDIDTMNSTISQKLPLIAVFGSLFGHRRFFHSPLALLILWFFWGKYQLGLIFCLGYAGHLLQDLFTRGGIPLLFPYGKRFELAPFKTGGVFDYITTTALISIIYCFYLR